VYEFEQPAAAVSTSTHDDSTLLLHPKPVHRLFDLPSQALPPRMQLLVRRSVEILRFRIREHRLRVMRFGNGQVEVLARFGDLVEVERG
jgi:hypothetical protein